MPSPTLGWFWAKLGNQTWPNEYHPVICHLIDVGHVADAVWRDVLRGRVQERITRSLGLPTQEHARAWIAFWIAAHDVGKLTPCFQFQGNTAALKTRLDGLGFRAATCGNPHHTLTGTKILRDAFLIGGENQPKFAEPVSIKVAVTVGGHHGSFPTGWDGLCDQLGDQNWADYRLRMLDHLAQLFGVTGLPVPDPPSNGDQSVWMFLAGFTSVADWIGSNTDFFPPAGNAAIADTGFDLNEYFYRSRGQAQRALNRLGWLGRREPTYTPVSFAEATGLQGNPRPLQEAIIPLAQAMQEPQLIIVEAPMGEGKTEAAWYVADCWDRCGGAGTYVALPTMATSNQMFNRVESFLKGICGKTNFMLLHGKAALNTQFEKLKFAARVYDPDGNTSAVVAESWFAANKKHGLLAPYGVGTIDQSLLAVLQTKHVFVRLFGLAGKCVILDEVHAYDAYMTTLMERLLRWLAALGCPVVLLSATLPAEKRKELIKAYAGDKTLEPDACDYPRITSVAVGGKPHVQPIEVDEKRKKEIHLGWVEDCHLAGKVKESLKAGGCAAVIRNTVGSAQETYTRLKQEFEGTDIAVELFHARFPFGRRQQIEVDVLAKFGKGTDGKPENPLRPKKAVLVATQVIEQSLDLDFDAMFTDVAPVDLVLQRAGRLHRHARGDRGTPKLWLIEPGKKDGLPDFGKSEGVYARFVLLKSLVALRAKKTVTLPDDLETLVEQIYGEESLDTPEHYRNDLKDSEAVMMNERDKQRLNATEVSIDAPDEDPLSQQCAELDEDDPSVNIKIQAATRDSEPTIQLILVYQIDGSDFLDPEGKEPFDETDVPDVKRLRQLLNNEVAISHGGVVAFYAKRPVPSGWKKSGMLKHHRIVRLNQTGHALAPEYCLRYEVNLGIILDPKSAVA